MMFFYHLFEAMLFMAFVVPYTAFLIFLCIKIMDISMFIGDKVVNFGLKILGLKVPREK